MYLEGGDENFKISGADAELSENLRSGKTI